MALTINLPDHVRAYIRRQVDEGHFPNEEAVITDAVTQVMDEYRWEEDQALLEAIAEVERGEAVPWTDDLRAKILHESEQAAMRGEVVPDDLRY